MRSTASSHPPQGFTFLELVLVLSLVSLAMLVAIPAFSTLLQNAAEAEMKRLSTVMQVIRSQAVLTNSTHRLVFDKTNSAYWVEIIHNHPNGKVSYQPAALTGILGVHRLTPSVQITQLQILNEAVTDDKPAYVQINAFGLSEPWQVELNTDEGHYTLSSLGWQPKVTFRKGTLEGIPRS